LTRRRDGATRLTVIEVDLPAIRRRLGARTARRYRGPDPERWAAVAAVLRPGSDGAEVLLIRRAEREGDPWSGHIAFPGGHRAAEDADLLATARRETREEVGLDLDVRDLVGALDEHSATMRGRFTGMVIAPYVFAVPAVPQLASNHEVEEIFWAPLGPIVRGEVDAVKEVEHAGERIRFPGYRVGEHVVWGLTHRMLGTFFDALAGRTPEP
jgi:8-oxo-dGTP pyrophosphatase MutT (NUDIX family)